MKQQSEWICFQPGENWVEFKQAAPVLEALQGVMRGWTLSSPGPGTPPAQPVQAVSSVGRAARGQALWDINSAYLAEPLLGVSTTGAVCTILADLIESYCDKLSGFIALHCGAFALNGRLIALVGPGRAGKSTLISRLGIHPKVSVYCDDVLPVSPQGQALALGTAPRLRLPLPSNANPSFAGFVERHLSLRDRQYGYLNTPGIVPHGTTSQLHTMVLLDRKPKGPARLSQMPRDEAVYSTMAQNITGFESAAQAITTAQQLTAGLDAYILEYSDLEEAANLLLKALDCAQGVTADTLLHNAGALAQHSHHVPPPVDHQQMFERQAECGIRQIEHSAFLWRAGDAVVWRLNSTAQAIWALLEVPGSAQELADCLAEVFPDVPKALLLADVAATLGLMHEEEFIQPSA